MGATDFTPVRPEIWTGNTAKACKGDPIALWLLSFLPTHFAQHSSGLYAFQVEFVAFRFGLEEDAVRRGLGKLAETGYCDYDPATDWVFVVRMAEIRHPDGFTPGTRRNDNMIKHFRRHVAACPSARLREAFTARYASTMLGVTVENGGQEPPSLGTDVVFGGQKPPSLGVTVENGGHVPPSLGVNVVFGGSDTAFSGQKPENAVVDHEKRRPSQETQTKTQTKTQTEAAAAHEREACEPEPPRYRADRRDPWPEEASARALAAYQTELERVALVPQGDAVEPFERAAVYLRDRLRHDPATIPATLAAIVAMAAKDPAFRAHPKHGDLFLRPNALMGRRAGSPDNLGVDVKIPEWLNRLTLARSPLPEPQKPKPEPGSLDALQAERLDWWSVSPDYGRGWDNADPERVTKLRAAGYPEPPCA